MILIHNIDGAFLNAPNHAKYIFSSCPCKAGNLPEETN
jgi:hypothetical protein